MLYRSFRNWPDFYHRINLWFNGIIAVSLLPFTWLFLEMETSPQRPDTVPNEIIEYLTFGGLALCIGLGYYVHLLHRKSRSGLKEIIKLSDKISGIYTAFVVHYLRAGGLGMLIFVLAFLTRSYVFVLAYLGLLFLLSLARPRYDRLLKYVRISREEEEILSKGKDFE